MAIKNMQGTTVSFHTELVDRASDLFPSVSFGELAIKALKKTLGEAELQRFAAAKRAEVEAEAQRLNAELQG
jgi:hypothetical protein